MFIAGMRVAIMNRSFSGAPIFEGYAYITKVLESSKDSLMARVRCKFYDEVGCLESKAYERNVHKDWQPNPEAWVKSQRESEGRADEAV